MPRYQLFVDDSGTREYDAGQNYTSSGKSLYFVYGAILIEQDASALLIPKLQAHKRFTFGTADVEIKSNWLRMPHERKKHYLDAHGISEKALDQFVDGYYTLLMQAPLSLIGSVVNKLHMQEDYGPPREPWYAPTAAYEILMQRAVQAVPTGFTLGVTVDDIGGKTPKSIPYKKMLSDHHAKLRAHGSNLQPSISFSCLDSPVRFVLSQHSDMIQAADLISYCIHRQFKDHGDDWEKLPTSGTELPAYEYFTRIESKFRTCGTARRRIQGFGIVKFPMRNRVRWAANQP